MIDFPIPTFIGQKFNSGTGAIYVWDGVAWNLDSSQTKTAKQKNFIVNPSMQISQENGNSNGGNGWFAADQWVMALSGLAAQIGRSQALVSPDNSGNTLLWGFNPATPSPAAGDYCQVYQRIEGQRVAELQWGTAKAIPAVLRFNACCDIAGTYTVSVTSGNSDYTWCGAFTVDGTQNLKTFSFAIPAQTAGTWAKDNTAGLTVRFCNAAGSTFGGALAGWQAGNKFALAGQTNGAATAGKYMFITDVGLYPDPLNTGLPPEFIVPLYEDDLFDCLRYFQRHDSTYAGYNNAAGTLQYAFSLPAEMRTTPTVAKLSDGSNTNLNSITHTPINSRTMVEQFAVSAAGGFGHFNGVYNTSARM